MVRTLCPRSRCQLVTLPGGGPSITPYHPVRQVPATVVKGVDDDEAPWRFPQDLSSVEERECEAVYSILLQNNASSLLIQGYEVVALAHGLAAETAAHPYFGTHAIVEDLEALPGFETEGKVDLVGFLRDGTTGLVCGLVPRFTRDLSTPGHIAPRHCGASPHCLTVVKEECESLQAVTVAA